MRHKNNIITFPTVAMDARVVEQITLEQFCAADEAAEYDSRLDISGMVILQWPRIVMVRCPMNVCVAMRLVDTPLEAYIDPELLTLDDVA